MRYYLYVDIHGVACTLIFIFSWVDCCCCCCRLLLFSVHSNVKMIYWLNVWKYHNYRVSKQLLLCSPWVVFFKNYFDFLIFFTEKKHSINQHRLWICSYFETSFFFSTNEKKAETKLLLLKLLDCECFFLLNSSYFFSYFSFIINFRLRKKIAYSLCSLYIAAKKKNDQKSRFFYNRGKKQNSQTIFYWDNDKQIVSVHFMSLICSEQF